MKSIFSFFLLIFLLAGCSDTSLPPIKISDFENDTSVKNLGIRLMELPYGLNSMEPSCPVRTESPQISAIWPPKRNWGGGVLLGGGS